MQHKGTRFFIQDWLPRLVSMVRVASSAGSCRRCTWRDWHGWSYCPLALWKRGKLQTSRNAPSDRNMQQKGTRFFIQDWLPRLVSLSGMVRVASSAGSGRRCTRRGCTFPKTKVDFMQNFFNSFVYVCSSAQHCRPPSHATFWKKMHCKYFRDNHKHFR